MASKEKKLVQLNIDELKSFLTHYINNNKFLQKSGKVPLAVNVEGPAGLGKTSAIMQLGEELGLQTVKINLAEIEEISDLVGFPVRQFQLCKGKECQWVDEQAVQEYIKQGYDFTGDKRMSYCPPEWIAGKGENGVLILDDFTRADQRFMQATMTLIDRQTYVSWSLPKGWTIILSTNPDDGNYQVTSLDGAQRTRFATVNLKFNVEVWARFAEKQGIDGRCTNFLLLHKELVKDDTNPRSITNFFNAISSIENFSEDLPLIQMIGEGSVGGEFTTMFTMFINNKLDKLITPKDILHNENEAYVLGQLRSCIGKHNTKDYRADIASILTTRIINYAVNYAEENPIPKEMIDRLIKLATDPDTLTEDLKYLLVKKIVNGNKVKFSRMMTDSKVIKMATK